jgi:hypothetical protein
VLPKYDRGVHEPVDGLAVAASQDVVVVEGLYLLSSAFAGLFDLSIYVDCSDQDSKERVVSRKVENGTPRADAEEQYGRVDSISMAAVKSTRGDADVMVDFGSEGGRFAMSSVELGPSAKTGVEGRILAVGLFFGHFPLSPPLPAFWPSPSLSPVPSHPRSSHSGRRLFCLQFLFFSKSLMVLSHSQISLCASQA